MSQKSNGSFKNRSSLTGTTLRNATAHTEARGTSITASTRSTIVHTKARSTAVNTEARSYNITVLIRSTTVHTDARNTTVHTEAKSFGWLSMVLRVFKIFDDFDNVLAFK